MPEVDNLSNTEVWLSRLPPALYCYYKVDYFHIAAWNTTELCSLSITAYPRGKMEISTKKCFPQKYTTFPRHCLGRHCLGKAGVKTSSCPFRNVEKSTNIPFT